MTSFQTFSYEEALTDNGKKSLNPSLLVDEDSSSLLLIIKLLSGSIKITNNYSNTEIYCSKNYFVNDLKGFGQKWRLKFPKLISEDISSEDIAKFVIANKFVNKTFYTNILYEISHFIYESKKKSHTTAFIFIYRLLEKIAYAFPMIYASKTDDFVLSFNQIKELMTSDSERKELGFLKKFIEVLYKDDPLFITSVDMYIYDGNAEIQEQLFNELKNVIEEKIIHEDTTEPTKLSVKYGEMGSFIITVRNRFFHNMNGHAKNIQSKNVADSDLLFLAINDCAMQWISTVFLGILSHSISEFQKLRNSI